MILFYAAENNSVVRTLEQQLVPYNVARCVTISAMEKRLRKPGHGLQVALILVRSGKEMDHVEEIQHLVRDLKVILVLPGHHSAMVAWAHKLAPRFIAYSDNGYEQVGAVLEKMLRPGKPVRSSAQKPMSERR